MDAVGERLSVERELDIAASPETVWELLTDPHEATRWMGLSAEFDLRPGGVYRVEVIPDNIARGEFVEIDPPRRLVFTWGWERSAAITAPGSSTVEFDLTPTATGTHLHFRHFDLPTVESAARHGHGWDHYLGRLSTAAAGDEPGVDPWLNGPLR